MAIGQVDYENWKAGKHLTHKQAIKAQCYICNGQGEGGEDCKGKNCPLYPFMPYNPSKTTSQKRIYSPEERKAISERFKKGKKTLL